MHTVNVTDDELDTIIDALSVVLSTSSEMTLAKMWARALIVVLGI